MFKFRSWYRINSRSTPLTPGVGACQDGSLFACHKTDLLLIDIWDHVQLGADTVHSVLAKQLELVVDKLLPKTIVGQDDSQRGLLPARESSGAGAGTSRGHRAWSRNSDSEQGQPCFISESWVCSEMGPRKSQRLEMDAEATCTSWMSVYKVFSAYTATLTTAVIWLLDSKSL